MRHNITITLDAPVRFDADSIKQFFQIAFEVHGLDINVTKSESLKYGTKSITEDEPYPLHRKVLS